MTKYTYSIASKFPSGVNISDFQKSVNDFVTITPNLDYIETLGDDIYLNFASPLSGTELTALETLMTSYTYEPILFFLSTVSVHPKLDSTNNTTYTKFGSYVFTGTDKGPSVKKVYFNGYMDTSITNYWVRLYDITNDSIIAENSFTNTAEEVCDLGTISNLPVAQATFEMQFRKNGGKQNKKVYVNGMTMYS